MLITYVKENLDRFKSIIHVLDLDHYTYCGEEGLVYDEYPLDDFCWTTGCSKICITYAGLAFKTSFSGYAYDYDYEAGDYYPEPVLEEWEEDFCKIEYEIYKRAVKEGVGNFFAETIKLTDKVYVQEESDEIFEKFLDSCDVLPQSLKGFSPEDITIFADNHGLLNLKTCLGSQTFRYFLDCYSISELQKLALFIKKYDINDLHENNIGWFDGKLKFFDFCGFHSLTSEKIKAKEI